MSPNQIIMILAALFFVLGALDRCLGNRIGFGKEFEKGFGLMGTVALSIMGLICIAPVVASLLEPVVVPLFRLLGGRKRIKPTLPTQPVAHLRHKTALFALPAFRVRESPDCRSDFIQGRKLAISQELEPGHAGKALGVLFGVEIPGAFKVQKGRRHTPRRRRG